MDIRYKFSFGKISDIRYPKKIIHIRKNIRYQKIIIYDMNIHKNRLEKFFSRFFDIGYFFRIWIIFSDIGYSKFFREKNYIGYPFEIFWKKS